MKSIRSMWLIKPNSSRKGRQKEREVVMGMKRKTRLTGMCSLIVLAAMSLMVGAARADVIIAGGNGSFETNPFSGGWGGYDATSATVPGWTFTVNGYWFMNSLYTATDPSAVPQDGSNWVNLTSNGMVIDTTITGLTIGNDYAVDFYAARRAGDVNLGNNDTLIATVNTTVPTTLSVVASTLSTEAGVYSPQTLNFTATATSQTLNIHGGYIFNNGLFVDNFSVAAVPEPASLGMLGVMGVAMLIRRRLRG